MRTIASEIYMRQYPIYLGKLLSNFRSIETDLRVFLLLNVKGYKKTVEFGENLWNLTDGAEVEDNPFTNYDNLEKLGKKYNEIILSDNMYPNNLTIELQTLIDLRDAFAHGRAFTSALPNIHVPFVLLKFEIPHNGKTKVNFIRNMTVDWFKKQIDWTKEEQNKIQNAEKIVINKKP